MYAYTWPQLCRKAHLRTAGYSKLVVESKDFWTFETPFPQVDFNHWCMIRGGGRVRPVDRSSRQILTQDRWSVQDGTLHVIC